MRQPSCCHMVLGKIEASWPWVVRNQKEAAQLDEPDARLSNLQVKHSAACASESVWVSEDVFYLPKQLNKTRTCSPPQAGFYGNVWWFLWILSRLLVSVSLLFSCVCDAGIQVLTLSCLATRCNGLYCCVFFLQPDVRLLRSGPHFYLYNYIVYITNNIKLHFLMK